MLVILMGVLALGSQSLAGPVERLPGLGGTHPAIASSFVFLGLAMALSQEGPRGNTVIVRAIAIGLALAAMAPLAVSVAAPSHGILRDFKMGALGAEALLLAAASIVADSLGFSRIAGLAALGVGALDLFALSGWCFLLIGDEPASRIAFSLPSTMAYFGFAFGMLVTNAKSPLFVAIHSPKASGRFARSLVPLVLLLPLAIGLLARTVERAGWIPAMSRSSLEAALIGLLLAAVTWTALEQQRAYERDSDRLAAALADHVSRLRLLHAVTSDPRASFGEKALALLEQVRLTLGLEAGFLLTIDGAALRSEVAVPGSAAEFVCPADHPVCLQILQRDGPVVMRTLPDSLDHGLPSVGGRAITALLGQRIVVDGRPFGMVCFIGTSPIKHPFAPDDLDQMRLIARWLEFEINGETSHRALDQARERLSAILSSVEDIIFSLAPDGSRTLYVSDASTRILGFSPAEFYIDSNLFFKAVLPEDREAVIAGFEAIVRDVPLDIEFRAYRRDRRLVWLRSRAHLVVDEKASPLRIDGITTDITLRKEADLEAAKARAEAEKANAAKSEFLSRMSHELRTPMNAILGFAQLLELERMSERQQDSVQQILKAGRHLLELVNEVLDLSRIEAGTLAMSLEPVELSKLVAEAVSLVRPMAAARQIALVRTSELEPFVHVTADRQRLRQVLLNLLSNAIKYSPVGAKVTIAERLVEGCARVAISDAGAGLNSAQVERLFVPFDRLGAETTGVEGTGLGLPLVKKLLESMGAALGFRSAPGEGSTFWADIRLAEKPASLVGPSESVNRVPANYEGPQREILLIEDNLSNVRLIEEIVRTMPGISLISAMQGRLGFDLAREHPPALILLDMNLPDVHGIELLRQIKAEPGLAKTPVVILSADATQRQIQNALDSGASSYLTKPFDVREFIDTIGRELNVEVA